MNFNPRYNIVCSYWGPENVFATADKLVLFLGWGRFSCLAPHSKFALSMFLFCWKKKNSELIVRSLFRGLVATPELAPRILNRLPAIQFADFACIVGRGYFINYTEVGVYLYSWTHVSSPFSFLWIPNDQSIRQRSYDQKVIYLSIPLSLCHSHINSKRRYRLSCVWVVKLVIEWVACLFKKVYLHLNFASNLQSSGGVVSGVLSDHHPVWNQKYTRERYLVCLVAKHAQDGVDKIHW